MDPFTRRKMDYNTGRISPFIPIFTPLDTTSMEEVLHTSENKFLFSKAVNVFGKDEIHIFQRKKHWQGPVTKFVDVLRFKIVGLRVSLSADTYTEDGYYFGGFHIDGTVEIKDSTCVIRLQNVTDKKFIESFGELFNINCIVKIEGIQDNWRPGRGCKTPDCEPNHYPNHKINF